MKKPTKELITGQMLTLNQALTVRNNIVETIRNTFLAGGVSPQQFEGEFEENAIAMAEDIVLTTQRVLIQQGIVDDILEEDKKPKASKKKITKKKK